MTFDCNFTASSLQNSCSAEQLHYDCILKSYNSQKLKELQSKSNTQITDCRIAALWLHLEVIQKSKIERTAVKLQQPNNSQSAVKLQWKVSQNKELQQPCQFGKGSWWNKYRVKKGNEVLVVFPQFFNSFYQLLRTHVYASRAMRDNLAAYSDNNVAYINMRAI